MSNVPALVVLFVASLSTAGCASADGTADPAPVQEQDISDSSCASPKLDKSFACTIAGSVEDHYQGANVCITYVRDGNSLVQGLVEKSSGSCALFRQSKAAIAKGGVSFVQTRVSQTRRTSYSEAKELGALSTQYRGATFRWLVGDFELF